MMKRAIVRIRKKRREVRSARGGRREKGRGIEAWRETLRRIKIDREE